jgi:hypothetical protein
MEVRSRWLSSHCSMRVIQSCYIGDWQQITHEGAATTVATKAARATMAAVKRIVDDN